MNCLHDHQIIITGVTGWLGQRLLDHLISGGHNLERDIIGISQSVKKLDCGITTTTFADIDSHIDNRPKILFHFGFSTKDKFTQEDEEAYIQSNIKIRENILKVLKHQSVKSMIYASSGAVYEYLKSTEKRDLFIYGKLKHDDEQIFQGTCQNLGIQYIQPRIFNLSGPRINKIEHYALANLIHSAIQNQAILIKAHHYVYRSYLDIDNLLELLLWLAQHRHESKTYFDATGDGSIELYDLAQKIKKLIPHFDHPIITQPERLGEDRYQGDPTRFRELLSNAGITPSPLEAQLSKTITYLSRGIE